MKKIETYGAVLAEIARLQQRAEGLRKSELPGVIERIREAIDAYGLTAADLGFGGAGGGGSVGNGKAPKAAKPAGAKRVTRAAAPGKLQVGVAKYRDPKTGKTWTGRGKPPLWIVGVKDRTPFLIGSGAATEAPAAAEPAPAKRGPKPGAKRGAKAAAAPAGRKRAGRKPAPADSGDQAAPAAG